MDRGAWQVTVHGVAQSWIWLKWLNSIGKKKKTKKTTTTNKRQPLKDKALVRFLKVKSGMRIHVGNVASLDMIYKKAKRHSI